MIDAPENFDFQHATEYCGVLFQNPDNLGNLEDTTEIAKKLKADNVIFCCISDLLSLALVKSPGSMGVDISIGSAQRFGIPMGYGGPHAGFMACRDEYKRKMPGRIIGVSKDVEGRPCYRMAMQTREQHIRRDKATSNICTA